MSRKRLRRVAPFLAILTGLLLGLWLARMALYAWLESGPGPTATSGPVAVLPQVERDLGTVSQGVVLQTTFRITNAGSRRLVLIEHAEACCDDSAAPRQIVLAPGDSAKLKVEVDTAQWCGQMEHAVLYTTNDPKLPRLALKVTATVESPPGT